MTTFLIIVAIAVTINFVLVVVSNELHKKGKCEEFYSLTWGK